MTNIFVYYVSTYPDIDLIKMCDLACMCRTGSKITVAARNVFPISNAAFNKTLHTKRNIPFIPTVKTFVIEDGNV